MSQVVRNQWRQTIRAEAAYLWKDSGLPVTYEEMVDIVLEAGMITPAEADNYRTTREKQDRWKLKDKANKAMYQLALGGPLTIGTVPFAPGDGDEFDFEVYELVTGNPAPGYAYVAAKEDD